MTTVSNQGAMAGQGSATSGAERGEEHVDQREAGRDGLRLLVRMLLVTVVLLAVVRVFVLEPYSIPTGSMKPTIKEGDELLVNKLPYVIRSLRTIPFTHIPIPYLELQGFGALHRGDVVVFDYPGPVPPRGEPEQFVKRCAAIAGDTIQLVGGRICVNGGEVRPHGAPDGGHEGDRCVAIDLERALELLRYGGRIIVPYAGFRIDLDSVAAARWRSLIEGEGYTVEYRNRIVFIGGLPATE
jgi:signal peptidase I